jgi:hypothetical protein
MKSATLPDDERVILSPNIENKACFPSGSGFLSQHIAE